MLWIRLVAIATILSPASIAAHSGCEQGPSRQGEPRRPDSTVATKERIGVREAACVIGRITGLLNLVELRVARTAWSHRKYKKSADQDAGRSHWHPFPSAEHRHDALNHVCHVLCYPRGSSTRFRGFIRDYSKFFRTSSGVALANL